MLHHLLFTGEFGSFEWSPNEIKLMYIAEKKNPKSEAFYKRKPNNEKKDIVQVDTFSKLLRLA